MKNSGTRILLLAPVQAAIVVLLAAAAYFAMLSNGFTYDDFLVVANNPYMGRNILPASLFSGRYFVYSGEGSYRPVVTLYYFLTARCFGTTPFAFHFTALFLHALTAGLIVLLMRRMGLNAGALWVGAAVGVHPMLSEAVCGAGFTEDILASLFSVLCLLETARNRRRGYVSSAIVLVLTACACFSKESGMALIFLIPAVLYASRQRQTAGEIAAVFIPAVMAVLLYAAVRFVVFPGPLQATVRLGRSFDEIAGSVSVIFMKYLGRMFFPATLSVDRVARIAEQINAPEILASAALHLALAGSALVLLKRIPLYSAGIFWFYASLAPVSNFIPLSCPEADRYLYLPAAGLFAAAAALCGGLSGNRKQAGGVMAAAGCILLSAWSARTQFRIRDWRNDGTLWTHELKINPRNDKALANMAAYRNHTGLHHNALMFADRATELNPGNSAAFLQMGKAKHMLGMPEAALDDYRKAISLQALAPFHLADAWLGAGMILDDHQQDYEEALQAYRAALEANPFCRNAALRLGVVHARRGDMASALTTWKKALELFPGDPDLAANIELAAKKEKSVLTGTRDTP